MPRGRKKIKKVSAPEPEPASTETVSAKFVDMNTMALPIETPESKKTYSCGCPFVTIDGTRYKAKCVKHAMS